MNRPSTSAKFEEWKNQMAPRRRRTSNVGVEVRNQVYIPMGIVR
jgi:hypothetical protein